MCGLAGSFRLDADVDAMLDRIAHRGPDGRGVETSGDAVHGHVRLAVLDVTDASAQPFRYRGGLLSYNGELWNHADLRAELASLGHRFSTTGDTEVLAAALTEWGVSRALPRLDGMFAFAWTAGGETWLARDRYGKLPLYCARWLGGVAWASERKGLGLTYGVPDPVPAGTSWRLSGLRTQPEPWYAVPRLSAADSACVRPLLERAVRKRLEVADVPVCALISGGVDSSAVATLAARLRPDIVCYLAVYNDEADDVRHARALAERIGVQLREVLIPEPTIEDVERSVYCVETSNKSQVEIGLLAMPLAERIRDDGFKVVLSGEGADELFGGYSNMLIKASRADDARWRDIRLEFLAKMGRSDFYRVNKTMMYGSVEARVPFMERDLVETVLSLNKAACPPGKGLLKDAVRDLVGDAIADRPKHTFQGGAGVKDAVAALIPNQRKTYAEMAKRIFGAARLP